MAERLEEELGTQLNLARVRKIAEGGDASKIPTGNASDGVRKVRVVKHVVGFKAQLKRFAFRNPGVLLKGEVCVPVAWAVQVPAAHISQRAEGLTSKR